MPTLILSQRHSADSQALWRAAVKRGWSIERVRGIRPPPVDDTDIVIYAEALLAPTIAEQLSRKLLDPSEAWLPRLEQRFKHRHVHLTTLGQARSAETPAFVKPPNDKTFTAQVFDTGAQLPTAFDDDVAVLSADPVRWLCEYRCFCLGDKVLTASPYLLGGEHASKSDYAAPAAELASAVAFTRAVLLASRHMTPHAIVIDVGIIDGVGWAVVEANGAWGAGIYGCNPNEVLNVIRHATVRGAALPHTAVKS